MTNRTRSRAVISVKGSPSTATRSASSPGVMEPIRVCRFIDSAPCEVRSISASIGFCPNRTRSMVSLALRPCAPALASVPITILSPGVLNAQEKPLSGGNQSPSKVRMSGTSRLQCDADCDVSQRKARNRYGNVHACIEHDALTIDTVYMPGLAGTLRREELGTRRSLVQNQSSRFVNNLAGN